MPRMASIDDLLRVMLNESPAWLLLGATPGIEYHIVSDI